MFSLAPRLFSLSYGQIDPSFNYAVNEAGEQGLSFGESFIATYGPLGFIIADYIPAQLMETSIWFLFFGAISAVGAYLFCRIYVKGFRRQLIAALGIIYCLNINNQGGFVEWNYLSTFLLFGFIYLRISDRKRIFLGGALAFIAAIFTLAKFTLGFGAIFSLLALTIFSAKSARDKIKQTSLVIFVYLIGALTLGSLLGTTNLVEYSKTAVIISKNFSSAMSMYGSNTWFATLLVFLAIAGLISWIILSQKKDSIRYIFLLPILGLSWKYCVVRQDGHILALIQVIIPIALFFYISRDNKSVNNSYILIAITLVSILSLWANNVQFYGRNGFAAAVASPLQNVVDRDFIRFFDLEGQRQSWSDKSIEQLKLAEIPTTMRNTIGDKGVDVFPWETSIIKANGLRWDNRPSPFSFETYDPYLDDLNSDFFESNEAPEFIIWHRTGLSGVPGIDFRYLLWDEPKTFRTIISHYDVVESSDSFLLLGRRDKPMNLDKQNISLGGLRANENWEELSYDKTKISFLSFEVKDGLVDKLRQTFFRSKPYQITIKKRNGEEASYRFVKENSRQGFLVNEMPSSWDEFIEFMEYRNLPAVDNPITHINIHN